MPIKLPKSFQRRKSSGNILEEVETHPQSSFRVFERPGPNRSMTDGAPLTKRMSEGNAVPSMIEDQENIFAGTNQSLDKSRYEHTHPRPWNYSLRKRLTRSHYSGVTYESSTSTRLSSSSTLPSSTEIPSEEAASPHSRLHDIPVPPPLSGALRAAGRTFSFGGRFSKNAGSQPLPRQTTPPEASRQRTVSGSTNDTATPPKLPDSHWDLGAGSDDFGKMFDHLGKRDSAMLRDPSPQRPDQYSSSPPTQPLSGYQEDRATRPPPISTDRSIPVEPSPYSWDSRHSRHHSGDGLLNDHDGDSPAHSTTDTITGFRRPSPGPSQMLGATTSHRALERPTRRQSDFSKLRRSGVYSYGSDASPIEDEDANLVRKSLLFSKDNSPSIWTEEAPSYLDKGKAVSPNYLNTEPESMFSGRQSPDPAIADHARLAVQFAENLPKTTSPGNKVMTPSQFEHYRQQQELRRSNSNATKSDDESGNEEFEDEEDETEKQREAERQRRKQEAHLSVYRQQMMKVTGQQAPSPSLRPEMSGASSSTPNLHNSNRLSHLGDKSSSGKSTEEDDDEVPLGILAAHGFPNRNRPPTRLANASSNPNLRASLQPSYASSAQSLYGTDAYNRSNLPAFARNLPPEPYVGANLVRESNRESLALGGGSGSVYGGASSPAPPPGGLINVIANEERARAARRGSPNTQAMFDPMGGMGSMGGVPRPYSMMSQHQQPPQITPAEQAQLNLSNQMSAMVQMQMEFMRNMMSMQGGQGTPPPMMPGMPMPGTGMPGMPSGPPSVTGRPISMPNAAGGAQPNFDQRTLGLLDPNNIAQRRGSPMPPMTGYPFPNKPGYAASIAPSERSNAGLASRYRPVSVANLENERPGTSPHLKPWMDENHLSPHSHTNLSKSTTMATVTVRPVSQAGQSPSGRRAQSGSGDEDEDEGWAEMMKKRDKKKSSWKMKRGTTSFGDLLGAVH
ncbi:uncharacterized protein N7469_000803 [Penicillium citrinum]|uniref:Uncharacterized protein n=1 Tax=Penicillium citrinum TaxID=5077 RepID=A0A9W9PDM7_PENCI|nr:uncharacterized protein N7469_000803 [Penicillium citrinum]KAJ5242476.1 hypothetical protein N7469_000803 [Penicillium citrinum]KAK5806872.1 hypothetical protein VI817_001130 [Penicillium citrinum]